MPSSLSAASGSACIRFRIAGITVQVEPNLALDERIYLPAIRKFRVDDPGDDTICLRYHYGLPQFDGQWLGHEVYRRSPFAIYRRADSWLYLGTLPGDTGALYRAAVFSRDYTSGDIYSPGEAEIRAGRLTSLSLFPTDQALLARLLADRQACYLHSSGLVLGGKGLLFVGHSEAGKSTTARMLQDEAEILCDDRVIVRRWDEGFRIHGTWSHGDIPDVSPASAPLRAILFIEKASANRISPRLSPGEIVRTLPQYVVRPLLTADWWEKTLALMARIAAEVPVYRLQLDKSGKVKEILNQL